MLALVGSGEYLPPMEPVDRYLLDQLQGEPRVVCLPTAAGREGAERIAYWSELGEAHFFRLGVKVEAVPIIDRSSANKLELVQRIRQANFVYLSGGKPDYLLHTLRGTRAWEAILGVHQSGGVLAGCSAGAMIMGARLPGFPRWQAAFSLLPGTVVVPHFDEISPRLVKLVRFLAARKMMLLGIEGNTALVVSRESRLVMGSGGVTMWNAHSKARYSQGQAVLL